METINPPCPVVHAMCRVAGCALTPAGASNQARKRKCVSPRHRHLALAMSTILGCVPLLSAPAFGQSEYDGGGELEEVIVTGTRIVREDGFGQVSPVTVVGMEEIESFGYTRIEDVLNTLPQVETENTSFDASGASGTASLDLRGLGSSRTLILINGHRMQPGGVYQYAPDVNQIPAQMVERADVLTGGASATYGADAVAGVVNFIMRRVDGVEISAGVSGYQHDNRNNYIQGLMDERGYDYPTGSTGLDGKTYNVSIVIGGDFSDGRGNATVYATWRKNDALLHGSRDYSSCSLNLEGTACGGSYYATEVPNFFIAPLTEDGFGPYGYDYFQEAFLVLQPDSSLMLDDPWNPSNVYNFAPINHYMRPDERWSLGAFVNYEINEHAVAYLETMGFSDQTTAQVAETGTFFYEVYPLQLSNAYFPENFRQSLEDLWPGEEDFGVLIGKRNTEGGPRRNVMDNTSLRIVTGLRGSINEDWDYDISYLHAKTRSSTAWLNDFYAPNIATAVDSRLCEAEPSCVPYQVFTYQGVTEESAASLAGTAVADANTGLTVIQTFLTGTTPWGLKAGNIMAAAGYEYRRVGFDAVSDNIYEQGLLLGISPLESLKGGYSVNEFFVEANIPLLAEARFARNMTLDLAYRWSDYSTSGSSSTYRLGLDWQVLDWLRMRSGFNRAVRAPNIEELYTPQQLGRFSGQDPCAGEFPAYSFEQCARSGVTAQQYGNIDALPEGQLGLNALYGGNPELDPEYADTFTAGVVIDLAEAMRLSLDYWDINIKGAIGFMYPAIALEQCLQYDRLCDLVHRAPGSGSLWRNRDGYVYGTPWNLSELHWRGVDVAWNWSPGANWRLDLIGSFYLKRSTTTIPNDPNTTFDCTGLVKSSGYWDGETASCYPNPKWRHTASVTYDSQGFWSLTGRWRYYSKVTYDGTVDQIAAKNLGMQNYFDVSAVFRFMGTHDLAIGVNNVLDEEPPLLGYTLTTNANSVSFYDQLGRYLFANLTLRW